MQPARAVLGVTAAPEMASLEEIAQFSKRDCSAKVSVSCKGTLRYKGQTKRRGIHKRCPILHNIRPSKLYCYTAILLSASYALGSRSL